MTVVEVFGELGELYEVVVAPAVSHYEGGAVFFADGLACGVEADQLKPEVVLLWRVGGSKSRVGCLFQFLCTLSSSRKRER